MPFYEITEEACHTWHDDEPVSNGAWEDDMADLYLRAEECWPHGATVRDTFPEDDPADFDD